MVEGLEGLDSEFLIFNVDPKLGEDLVIVIDWDCHEVKINVSILQICLSIGISKHKPALVLEGSLSQLDLLQFEYVGEAPLDQ